MKKILILLLIHASINLYSQDYHPLLDTATIWTVGYHDYIEMPPEYWQIQYQFKKDTLFDTISYKYFGNQAFLREDTINKTVFMRNGGAFNDECLLYDFNAQQGDTIDVCNFQIVIDSVSKIYISNGEERKIFYCQGTITGEYYIEGIGSNEGFIEISEPIGPPSIELMCVKKQNVELYGIRCDEVTSISNQSRKNINITIYPNPTNTFLKFDSDVHLKSFRIVDISGKCILNNTITDDIIELIGFKTGFYIIEFYDNDNNIVGRNEIIYR